jgi:hypothetical protein
MTTAEEISRELDAVKSALKKRKLSDAELEELASDLARIREHVEQRPERRYTILEWWGVGKNFWAEMDVDEYIRKERESWR